MITKKTRLMSAFAAFLMLVSMFAMIVLPASAATYFDEVISATGLKDASAYPDIATATSTAVGTYKVTNRAGLEKLSELVYGGNTLKGYTFYQTADIDMGWEPFAGIGDKNKRSSDSAANAFRFGGTYDGNGFVIENLFINLPNVANGCGLFGSPLNATIKNVGIASGLIVGCDETGPICGEAVDTTIANCWSAATVFGGGTNGTAGIAGKACGASKIYNCYNLGVVFNFGGYASGMAGWVNDAGFELYNCYNAGQIVTAIAATDIGTGGDLRGYTAMIRADSYSTRWAVNEAEGKLGFLAGNNYYVDGTGVDSYKYFIENVQGKVDGAYAETITANDQATRVEAAALTATDATSLAAQLNGGDLTKGAPEGYALRFENSTAGYPVLTYVKDGAVAVKRTAHTSDNVLNADKLVNGSSIFKKIYDNRTGGFAAEGNARLANDEGILEINNANDFWIFGAVSVRHSGSLKPNYGFQSLAFTADIDCAEMDLFPIDIFFSLGIESTLNFPVEGNHHIIKNFHTYSLIANANACSALFPYANGGSISNLGMVDPHVEVEFVTNKGVAGYAYPAFFLDRNGGPVTLENLFVSNGRVDFYNGGYGHNNNAGIFSRTMKNAKVIMTDCWVDGLAYSNGIAQEKMRVLGSNGGSITADNVVLTNCVYSSAFPTSGDANNFLIDLQTNVDLSAADGSLAYFLNNGNSNSVWTCADGHTVWGDETNRTGRVSLELSTGSSVIETRNYYLNAGETFTLPTIANYEVDETSLPATIEDGRFEMGSEDVTITYLTSGVDLTLLTDLIDKYESLDLDIFVNSASIEEFVTTLQEAYEYYTATGNYEGEEAPDLTDPTVIDEFNYEYEGWMEQETELDLTLVDVYPYYPAYADRDFFEDLNTSKNWAITSKEDWLAVIEDSKSSNLANETLHLVGNIDFGGTKMQPVGYTNANSFKTFNGTFDGHGYAFENINISETMNTTPLGLFSIVGSVGTIKNFGVASGNVTAVYTNSGDGIGIGGIAGQSDGGSRFSSVWNGATVSATVSGSGNKWLSIAGIVGRGYGTTELNGCYNIGKVVSPGHASALNDWGQNAAYTFNSFGAGELLGSSTGMIRHNTETTNEMIAGASDQISNAWAVGINFSAGDTAKINESMKAYLLGADAYETGEVGYLINQNYVAGKGERVYFTYDGEKTLHGTAANQTRKISLHNDNVAEDIVFYAAAGSTVDLSEYVIGATFTLADGSEGVITETTLTVPNSDPIVNYEMSGLVYVDLKAAVDAWEGLNFDYFVNGDETAALVEAATEKMLANTYEDQDAVNADAAVLNAAHVYKAAPALPTTSEMADYPDAPGYMIMNEDDYLELSIKDRTVDAAKTIYLGADITMTAASNNMTLSDLVATFDGMNHSITGLKVNSGLFNSITTLRNVKFIDCHATSCGWNSALLINQTAKNNILMENLTFVNCSSTKVSSNGISLMIAQFTGDKLTYRNIVVDGCTLDIVANPGMCNVGFLGGTHSGTNITVEDVIVKNSHIEASTASNGSGRGLVFGEQTGANAIYKNIALYNNSSTHPGWGVNGSVVGVFKTNATAIATNILIYGNTVTGTETGWTTNPFDGANNTEEFLTKTNVSVRYAASAYATAYANNQVEGAKTWAINSDGEAIFATEGLPVKVTFVVGEETYDYYTDNTGAMLLADSDMIAANEWDKEIAAVHTEDTVYTAKTCEHVMAEEWTHVEGTETHTRACTLDCGYVETVGCEYTSVVTDPTCCAAGYVTKTCTACGNVIVEDGAPATGEHVWGDWYVDTPATTSAPGVEKRVCTTEGCTAFETREIPVLEFVAGDANGSGTVDVADVIAIMKAFAGGTVEGYNAAAADYDGNGKVEMTDAIALLGGLAS